jgi:hypothetical protein
MVMLLLFPHLQKVPAASFKSSLMTACPDFVEKNNPLPFPAGSNHGMNKTVGNQEKYLLYVPA